MGKSRSRFRNWRSYAGVAGAAYNLWRGGRRKAGRKRKAGNVLGMRKRFKFRRGSYTRTRTRKRRRGSAAYGTGGDASYIRLSGLGRKRRFLGMVERALASKGKYMNLGSFRITSGSNEQGVEALEFFSTTQIKAMFNQVNGTSPNEGNKLYITNGVLRSQLVNQSNIMCTVWMYECCLRKDAAAVFLPADDWKIGVDVEGGATNDYLLPFSTPYQSKRFCTNYLIKKGTKVMLAPGEEHIHYVKTSVCGSINMARLYVPGGFSFTPAEFGVGNLTHFTLYVTLGGVYNDETTTTAVGYAPSAVDVAWTFTAKCSALYDDKMSYRVTSNLPSITTGKLMVEVDADPSLFVSA